MIAFQPELAQVKPERRSYLRPDMQGLGVFPCTDLGEQSEPCSKKEMVGMMRQILCISQDSPHRAAYYRIQRSRKFITEANKNFRPNSYHFRHSKLSSLLAEISQILSSCILKR